MQPLAARWLRPRLVVVTNVRADHEEIWGPGRDGARRALLAGIPREVPVLLGEEPSFDGVLLRALRERGNILIPVAGGGGGYETSNRRLALGAFAFFGLDPSKVAFEPFLVDDPGRFRLLKGDSGLLAFAFSANDPESTEALWGSTEWKSEETAVLFNHRKDRPRRFEAFLPWLASRRWKSLFLCGSHPWRPVAGFRWIPVTSSQELKVLVDRSGRLFGCGNAAGLPRDVLERFEEVPT